jgi:hypothetical protein
LWDVRFVAYSAPDAFFVRFSGGFLVGLYLNDGSTKNIEPGSHFDPNLPSGSSSMRYMWMLEPVKELRTVVVRILRSCMSTRSDFSRIATERNDMA